MNLAVHPRTPASHAAGCAVRGEHEALAPLPAVMLPVRTRSVSLLTLLLQDAAIDLELASSVVGLDPGLAFATLQLANARRREAAPIWQLPLAIVEAGRESLEYLVRHARTVEGNAAGRGRLVEVADHAVARACVGHGLARELDTCSPRKAFLCGLLFDLPQLAPAGHAASPSAGALLAVLVRLLPADMVRAVTVADTAATVDALAALVLLADAVVAAQSTPAADRIEELAASGLWRCWNDIDGGRRRTLLDRAFDVAGWAAASLAGMHPWEFMAKLESRSSRR